MKHLGILILCLCYFSNGWAQKSRFKVYKENSQQRALLKKSKPLSIFYEKVSWNQKANAIENGYIYLRDRQTGQLIELNMSETAPNSSVFSIDFPIGTLPRDKIATEVYSAPQTMLQGQNRTQVMEKLIKDKSVKRKPFLLRVLRGKGQIVDVFDDKETAIASYNKYREQMGLSTRSEESQSIIQVTNKEKPTKKKIIDTSTLQSLFLANENDLDANNQKNKELRDVLRNIEEKRRKKVKEDASAWSSRTRKANERKATNKIKEGVSELKNSQFAASREAFFSASDLRPDKEDIYQQYGVSLFRDKKFNQSIVILELSQPTTQRQVEKDFYLGMNYYQLKDYEKAVEYFEKVKKTKNKAFAPTAAFYLGSALIELKKFDEAKAAFQFVLDNSTDPKMDEKAEKFIEYALDRKTLEEKRSNWFFIDGVLGLIYDSNIVLATDQAREQGQVTDEEGWRFLAQATARARPYYSQNDEVSVALDITALQSFDEGFGSNETAEQADPYLIGLSVPWTHRTTLGGKGYFFDLVPGYETIIMDLDGTGKATITNSIKLDMNNTLVINKNWIAKGDYSFSSNDSSILGDETGADSFGAAIRLSSIFIVNKDQERYLIPEFGFRTNDANSSIYAFNRIDLAVTFTSSVFENYIWNSRLAYYLANYENNRTDNNYTLTTGISTRISRHWNWGLTGSYIINDSTTQQYNKFNIASTFSFSY
ncbi:MAG: tetratricopeptide repeat protein [Pseudomonadota bacterium]